MLKRAGFVFFCRVAGAGLVFVTQVFMARWMGAEQLGVYVLAFSLCLILGTVSTLGIPTAAIAHIGAALANERAGLIVGFSRRTAQLLTASGAAVCALCLLAVSLSDGLVAPGSSPAFVFAFLIVPVFALSASRASVALGMSWIPQAVFPNTVFRPALFLALVAGAMLLNERVDAATAVALQLSAFIVMTVGQSFLVNRSLGKTFPGVAPEYETPKWIRTALPLLIITLFANYFIELNIFAAGLYLGHADLAVFNAGLRVSALLVFGIAAVDTVVMPKFSKLHAAGDRAALQDAVTQAARLRLIAAVSMSLPIVVFGRFILGLFGESFVAGYEALLLLTASQVLTGVFGPAVRLLSVTGYQDQCIGVSVASLIAMFLLHPLLIEHFGLTGAALAVVCVVLIQSVWHYRLAIRYLGIRSLAIQLRKA